MYKFKSNIRFVTLGKNNIGRTKTVSSIILSGYNKLNIGQSWVQLLSGYTKLPKIKLDKANNAYFFFKLIAKTARKLWSIVFFCANRQDFLHVLACGGWVFSSQMIVDLSVGCWALTGSSSDHIIILAVRRWSWKEMDSWSFGSGLFWVLFNVCSISQSDGSKSDKKSKTMFSYTLFCMGGMENKGNNPYQI